jgi:pimeloyl-ACP methyl ester carboxylesterase
MKKILYLICVIAIGFTSCFRLDNNLYNPSKETAYLLDSYTGDVDFTLDASYKIPDSLIHVFSLQSQAPGESSSTTIYAIYVGEISKIAIDTVIMYCHGNKCCMDFYWPRAKLLANVGGKNHYGVLMVDYRGYGMSQGTPSEAGLYADVDVCLQWLKSYGLTNSRLMMYGFSMGTAPATMLTANPRSMTPAKLILEAPFASAATMADDASQLAMPGSFVTSLKIDNAEEIKSVQQPFMWIHGMDDTFLNYKTNGMVVYNNYEGTYKEKHLIPGANHSTIEIYYGFTNYCNDLNTFIRR